MLDWLAVGRAIGDAVESATADPAEDEDDDDSTAQEQADKAEAGGSGSDNVD